LGKQLNMTFFKVVGVVVSVCVIVLWFVVAVKTVIEGIGGKLFYAPCLAAIGVDRIPEAVESPPAQSRRTSAMTSSTSVASAAS
jgi:hypothetical protein